MRQWAILIGLNKYQMFQPLNCAQQDAQALHQLLVHEVGLPPEQCLLFTDDSPPISGRPTNPTRANFHSWIELLTQQCFKPGDTLWFFFSGYGVCSQGRDYLVPLDGDPFAVETTCILMSDIFSRLQASLSPGLPIVLFDINRSQGNFSNENVGTQTARLAKQLAVPTILSCQPGQYSREISGLGHGLFAIALMEALKYHQAATPATLMRFLGDRLPELGAYYYLPNQQTLSLCPPEQVHQPLIQAQFSNPFSADSNGNGNAHYAAVVPDNTPSQQVSSTASGMGIATARANPSSPYPATDTQPSNNAVNSSNGIPHGMAPNNIGTARNRFDSVADSNSVANSNGQSLTSTVVVPSLSVASSNTQVIPTTAPPLAPPPTQISPSPASLPQHSAPVAPEASPVAPLEPLVEPVSSGRLWLPILLWGSLLSLGLIGCVLWRNWAAIQAPSQATSSPTSEIMPSPGTLPSLPSVGTPPDPANVEPNLNNPSSTPSTTSPPTSDSVETALSSQTETSATTPQPPDQALNFDPNGTPAAITGQAILENARTRVLSDQATPYRDAIDEARRIQPNDPAYILAQQDIAAWSQRIVNIAQQRVTQKQWDIAIMAANLVPEDDRELHPQAQALIAESCPAIQGQPSTSFTIQKAKAICSQKPI